MSERRWTIWDGTPLDGAVYFDCETDPVSDERPWEPPRLAMLGATDGGPAAIVRPEDVGRFVRNHHDRVWIGFNCASFDFHVVLRQLHTLDDDEAAEAWWRIAEGNRLRDLFIRDRLIELARDGTNWAPPKDLAEAVQCYTSAQPPDKGSAYRKRYGETIGADWSTLDPGFFEYLAGDVAPLPELDRATAKLAARVVVCHRREFDAEIAKKCGLLTEHVQVKAAIALRQIEINGVALDRERIAQVRAGLEAAIAEGIEAIRSTPACAALLRADGEGRVLRTPSGAPKCNSKELRRLLEWARQEALQKGVFVPRPPRTDTGLTTTSARFWGEHRHAHPFINTWFRIGENAKLLAFYAEAPERIHPRYRPMVRTGRTSSSGPNIQQIPRDAGLRECHVPTEGHFFIQADYSAIEMVGLAAACEFRYGRSALADTLRSGADPHCHTAAMMLGMGQAEFEAMRNENEAEYKSARQRAKAINFGVPGGLGAEALMQYARATYGVALSEAEARDLRDRFKDDAYPEIGRFLEQDMVGALAANLCITRENVMALFTAHFDCDNPEGVARLIRRIVSGETTAASSGRPYSDGTVNAVWAFLSDACANPELRADVAARHAGWRLANALFNESAVTLTGRVRGRTNYTATRNTQFQGLCADGAKLALFGLLRAGYRVAAFVHDEVLVEVPRGADHRAEAERISDILRTGMDAATGGHVPSKVEYTLTERWSKNAKELTGPDGELLVWREEEDAV